MKTILAPIDLSPVSERVVAAAASLARALDGRVVLLNVAPAPAIIAEYGAIFESLDGDFIAWTEMVKKSALKRLERIQDGLENDFVRAESMELMGDPVPVIIEQAEKLPADYIVIGSHEHGAFFELVIGSTTSGVLKKAPCPVVIVPAVKKALTRKNRELPPARGVTLTAGRKNAAQPV